MIVAALRHTPLAQELSEDELQQLAGAARQEEYAVGADLFRQGEFMARVLLVLEGSVALEIDLPEHEVRQIQTVGPGELLCWSPLLGSLCVTATARTKTPTRLISLDARQLLNLCQDDPRLGFALMKRTARALATRLAVARGELHDACEQKLHFIPGIHEGAD
jgi:CRP-like cAMP-binding protein